MNTKKFSNSGEMTAGTNAYIIGEEILNNGIIGAGNMLCIPNGSYSGTGSVSAKVILATEYTINKIKSSGKYNKNAHFAVIPEHNEPWGREECDTAYSNFLAHHEGL